ncbi:MAG: hypothetical protein IJK60_00005, partial [Clostridia bacterium]|nr:hypothetical protein [Clostridia bacterium]
PLSLAGCTRKPAPLTGAPTWISEIGFRISDVGFQTGLWGIATVFKTGAGGARRQFEIWNLSFGIKNGTDVSVPYVFNL